jgi:TolB-like protein/class 3 adenylate cyclase
MSETKAPDPTGRPPDRRKLVAVLYADMVGYSRLIGLDDAGTLQRLRTLRREVIDPVIDEHGGRIVQTGGDSLLIVFDSIDGAVRCAVKVQQQVPIHDGGQPADQAIRFRIGINLGDAIPDGPDLHGDVVNVAARLQAECPPGGICVSGQVHNQVRDRLGLVFEELGPLALKNIARPVEAFLLQANPPDAIPNRVERSIAHSMRELLPLPDKPSLAVLPFTNFGDDLDQEYFADGMVEDITTALSKIRWLFVVARNSSFTYKGMSVDVRRVGRELGVRYVLEGSVRKVGQQVRIAVQLINALNGSHIWAGHFDNTLENVFELQDEVASRVAGVLEPQLRRTEIARANCQPTQHYDLYDLYLRALGEFHKHTAEATRSALALLTKVLATDPSFARAAALICECRLTMTLNGWDHVSDTEVAESVELARYVVQSAKDDPDALWMAAIYLSGFSQEHSLAESAVDRALTLNPNAAHAWNVKGWILIDQSRARAAIDAFHRALRLSPLDPLRGYFTGGLALAYLTEEEYQEAYAWATLSIHEMPRYTTALGAMTVASAHLDRIEEAGEWLARLLHVEPNLTVLSWRSSKATYPARLKSIFEAGLHKAGLSPE